MTAPASMRAVVSGYVQGVSFRAFVSLKARGLGLTGYVRNQPDGTVEVVAEGDKERLEKLIAFLKIGPRAARVQRVDVDFSDFTGKYPDFRIKH